MGKIRETIERYFSAVTFAESGCTEIARELLGVSPTPKPFGLDDFILTVGLQGAKLYYCEVPVH